MWYWRIKIIVNEYNWFHGAYNWLNIFRWWLSFWIINSLVSLINIQSFNIWFRSFIFVLVIGSMVPIFCDCCRVSGSEISIGSLVRSFLIMTQFLGWLVFWFEISRWRHSYWKIGCMVWYWKITTYFLNWCPAVPIVGGWPLTSPAVPCHYTAVHLSPSPVIVTSRPF